MRHIRWVLLAVLVVLALAGCSLSEKGLVDADQLSWDGQSTLVLEPGQPVGQTFVARHSGLSGVDFLLLPEGGAPQTLTLHLRTDPQATTDLVTASLLLPADATTGFFHFAFPPLADSHGQYYYAFLSSETPGVTVAQAAGEAYLDGAAYQDHEPLDAQTGFRLTYTPHYIALDLARAILGWMGLLAAAGFLFVVPGWALLAWLLPTRRLNWAERLGLAAGVGLALYPLLLLWTDVVGLHLGALYAWLPPLLGSAALIWRYRTWRPAQGWEALRRWARSEARWPDLTLLLLLGLVFGVRLLVVRGLEAPMWGDSYQHTMIAQLLVDNGGLFDSWEPYVPLKSFTYHFGFHTAVASYHWLTRSPILDSILLMGQVVNGLAILSLYPLTLKLTGGDRWAGAWAVLVAGLLFPMPMYYVNWGRYVQLAGQVILPVAMWLTLETLSSRRRLKLWLLTGLTIAGLGLTHYRVSIYYLLFLPVAWAAGTLKAWKNKTALRAPLLRLVPVLFVALTLSFPWIWRLGSGYLVEILTEFSRVHKSTTAISQLDVLLNFDFFIPASLLIASLAGMALGLLRRQAWVLFLAAWVALLFLAANPNWLGLPGAATVSNFEGVLNNFTVLLSLYMPASILCGYLGSTLIKVLPERSPWLRGVVIASVLLILVVSGLKSSLTILDAKHVLVTRPDLQAMQWIEKHTGKESIFLANSFFAYDEHVIVGSDAGWWLPLLAHRQNTVPPITYGHEAAYEPDYISRVNGLARYVASSDLGASETVETLKRVGISHIFIGQQGGYLSWEKLQASELYELAYHKDRVWIFEIR